MEESLESISQLCLGISWGLCCSEALMIFHLVQSNRPHTKRTWPSAGSPVLFCLWCLKLVMLKLKSLTKVISLQLLLLCQCTNCYDTDVMCHGHTPSFWVRMSEGTSVWPQHNSTSFNRNGWKIIAVSRSRENTEWISLWGNQNFTASYL